MNENPNLETATKRLSRDNKPFQKCAIKTVDRQVRSESVPGQNPIGVKQGQFRSYFSSRSVRRLRWPMFRIGAARQERGREVRKGFLREKKSVLTVE